MTKAGETSRRKIRLPLPRQKSGPQGPPKGKKGYDRKRERREVEREVASKEEESEEEK